MTTWLNKHLQRFQAIILMIVMVFSVFANKASGASIPTVTASLSNHTKSVAANHSYKFQTPSGIDSPTDTITIDLSSWATGAVNSGDIDLFHGPVTGLENNNTVAAVPGVNIWGAAFAGGILTLTPPTNALPGTIAPNDYVNVYIGTNAAGGVNQLTNPATAGSYAITIGGGFGDIAYLAQAIMNSGSVSVDATVGISLQITNLNPSSVVAASGAFNMTITGIGFVTSSVGQITGVARPTIYVSSTQLLVSILASDILVAGTKQITVNNPIPGITSNQLPLTITSASTGGGGTSDTTPPVILNPQAINITQTGARIIWDTDESATSIVNYGLTNSYGATVSNGSLVISHGIDITGLSPSTTYHFRVQSADQYGNNAVSSDYAFTTLPWPPLQIYNVTSTSIADTSAIIVWDTNRPANSRVQYGLTSGLGIFTTQVGFVSNHATPLTSLTPNTLYYYRVISYDVNGIGATSTIYTFRTTYDQTPPTNITLTAVPGDKIVYLSWTHSLEPDFSGVRLIRKLGSFPTGPFDGTLVYNGLATTTIDTGLTNGVTYYYGAYAYDTNGNFASGALDDATPFAGLIPPTPTSTTTTPPLPPGPTSTPPLPPPGPTTPPATSTTPTVIPSNLQISPIYYGANGTLLLEPDAAGVRGVLSGETVFVRVQIVNIGEQAQSATILVDGQLYSLVLSADGTEFTGTFPAPASGLFPTNVRVMLVSGAFAERVDDFAVQNPGEVVEARIIAGTTPIPNATVTLYQVVNGLSYIWNGAPYGQANPILSDNDGRFVFRVPNGDYYVEVSKVGYTLQRSAVTKIERNVFGDRVELIYIPAPLFLSVCKVDCSKISYDLYIINPDGTERHTNTDYSQTIDQGEGIVLHRFEDQGQNFDYNNILIQVDKTNCEHLKFTIVGINSELKHQVRVKIFYEGEQRSDVLLASDSSEAYGQTITLNLTDDQTLCKEPVEEIIQIETIPEQVEFTILTTLDLIREPQIVTAANDFAIPAITLISLMNLGTALSLFNLLAYLQYLFTQPILLFGRMRKRRYGVVYNSLNKQPVDMAVIRLIHAETGLVVQTIVTDKQGRYIFNAKQGDYIIQAVKPQYDFPTQYLANKKSDAVFADIYHGESISLKEDGVIALNVPLDPNKPVETPRRVIYRRFLRRLQHGIAIAGITLAGVSFVISPSWFIGTVVIVQIGFYFLFRQLALPAKAQPWGHIFDANTKKPVSNAVVRIFDKQFNKLLETQLTSGSGKYGFFAEHSTYYITIEKEGYQKYTSQPLDLGSRADTAIDLNVALKRISPEKN